MKKQIELYLKLIRFDKPIGSILLSWPCLWGIAYAYHTTHVTLVSCIYWAAHLTTGAFLMRSFGCIINDIVDCELDSHVERTKNRPLASGKLKIHFALLCAFLIGICAFFVFMPLPTLAKIYAFSGGILLFIYPTMKRITYYPQVILGLAFNLGVPIGYTCVLGTPTLEMWCLYVCGVLWTIAYDTIYAFQDISDDEKMGIKSTAVRFKHRPKHFVGICYLVGFILLYFVKITLVYS